MNLHMPTLTLAMMAAFWLLLVQYTLASRRWLPRGAIRRWANLGLLLFGATAAMAWHVRDPFWVAPLTAALALGSGVMTLVLALLRFMRRRPHHRRLKLAFGAYCVVVTASCVLCPVPLRVALNALAFAAFVLPLVTVVQRYGWHAERALRAVVVALWVLEAVALLRGVHALLQPELFASGILGATPASVAVPYALGLLALLATAFGYVLALQERATLRLRQLAARDPLTGLANRRHFEVCGAAALAQVARSADWLALALIDIDNFKRINDQYGHAAGDAALRHLAQVLRSRLRRGDLLARWGGEEFALLLPATTREGALHVVSGLRAALKANPLPVGDQQALVLTLSIGWLSLPPGQAAPRTEHLMRALDEAMYAVKQDGKDGEREALLDAEPTHDRVPNLAHAEQDTATIDRAIDPAGAAPSPLPSLRC